MESKIFTVSQLNERIKDLFDCDPTLLDICVSGELSNYKVYPSGHHYFTLKDSESSVRCVMFRSNACRIKFKPENGLQVVAFGKVSVYPKDGVYQLYCTGLMQDGVGLLQQRFEALKAKLFNEGLFDEAHKKPLPEYPAKIALVTSSAGAAVRDMIRILRVRWPLTDVVVVPVRVQGTEAPGEIAEAIDFVNKNKLADIIITGRGGGSAEDLWAFNEEIVARAIFRSEIPVISAVGHEPDVAISDYVADRRASTPSNAAEIAVKNRADELELIEQYSARINKAVSAEIASQKSRLENINLKYFARFKENLIDSARLRLDSDFDSMNDSLDSMLKEKRHSLSLLKEKLLALGPYQVLNRGYSIVQNESGALVASVSSVNSGERLVITVKDGKISCIADQ